jgi:hypothetical protein
MCNTYCTYPSSPRHCNEYEKVCALIGLHCNRDLRKYAGLNVPPVRRHCMWHVVQATAIPTLRETEQSRKNSAYDELTYVTTLCEFRSSPSKQNEQRIWS